VIQIGLTGGIGSGKSTVTGRLSELGAIVIDADAIAREVVEPGTPGLLQVVVRFGDEILAADGTLNRAKLGSIVFADPEALADLNAIVHPLVGARTAELMTRAADDDVVVYDVPLLVENKLQDGFDAVLVVEAPLEARLKRLVGRGLAEDDARSRIAAQATDEQRREVATVVLDNAGSVAELLEQVDDAYRRLTTPGLDSANPIG
jgi:dephospho-CoA kinase